jgi:hypothetical protein
MLVFAVVRLWRAPPGHVSYRKAPWWPWGETLWQGYRRTLLPAALVSVCFALALTLPPSAGVYFGVAAFVVLVPVMIAIVLFNHPKFLVPPACRTQRGLISSWPTGSTPD